MVSESGWSTLERTGRLHTARFKLQISTRSSFDIENISKERLHETNIKTRFKCLQHIRGKNNFSTFALPDVWNTMWKRYINELGELYYKCVDTIYNRTQLTILNNYWHYSSTCTSTLNCCENWLVLHWLFHVGTVKSMTSSFIVYWQ